jgi:hypothetical protein
MDGSSENPAQPMRSLPEHTDAGELKRSPQTLIDVCLTGTRVQDRGSLCAPPFQKRAFGRFPRARTGRGKRLKVSLAAGAPKQ